MAAVLTLAEPLREQSALLKRFKGSFHELSKVSTQRIARVEVENELSSEQLTALHALLLDGSAEKVSHETLPHAKIVEMAFQPAVLDPEHTAIQKMIDSLDFGDQILAVKMATVYAFEGLTEDQARELVDEFLFNELLHVIITPGNEPTSLVIHAEAEPTEIIEGFRDMNLRQLKELSEARSLYMEDHYLEETQRKFRDDLQRDPTDAELEYLAQRTSDHCFHTTWKSLGLFKELKKEVDSVLPKRPDIVSVFVDNSGVMAAGDEDEMTYMIKGETHNSPTAIAPVGGVETMHGGCLRDIMGTGQGGYPSMASQVFIIGSQSKEEMAKKYKVDTFLDPLVILRGMIQGVQNYGNPMGVPNFGGRVFRHPQFFGKPLALGICLGTGERKYSKIGTPQKGDIALLVGNPTGRDGIHGATMSSAASSEEMIKKEGAAVQIGDPYTERLIMEATPKLRPLLRAYGDLGAGGIASCFGEMAEGVGIEIDLEHLPTKYEGLSPWEKLESEAQERMGMAVAPEHLEEVKAILDAHEVPYFELGTFTGSERFVVKHGEETIVDLDYEWLEGFPVPQKKVDDFFLEKQEVRLEQPDESIKDSLMKVLQMPELADQSLFLRRWDSTVQGKSLRESCAPFTNMPYDQGISVPDPETGITQVLSLTVNPWWSGNPYNMARATFAGTVSKQIAAGVPRKKIAMCDNFYTPKARPEVDFHLTEMVRAINTMMTDLETPMISGKDSSSGTTKMERLSDEQIESFEIVPTICMSAMGAGPDAMKVPPKAFQKAGNKLYLVATGINNDASGSVLLNEKTRGDFFNFEINIQQYIFAIDALHELINDEKIASISVLDDGGVFHRIFEMMLGSGLGADIILPEHEKNWLEFLTRVTPGAFIIEAESAEKLEGLDAVEIGSVIDTPEMQIGDAVLKLSELKKTWHQTWYDILNVPKEHESIEAPESVLPYTPQQINKKKVSVVYSAGINCHQEMVRCWEKLGCDVNLVSVTDPHARFADADIVVFPGGFADGDYLGSAKVWYRIMETQFMDQMEYLKKGTKPVLGICNGFQLMTRAGFFGDNLRLTFNDSAVFEQRWVRTTFTEESSQSIWTRGLEGKELVVPVAHGEGKFVIEGEMNAATISMVYSPNTYPNNPNGSDKDIAGVFAGEHGQFWGGMPHPERAIEDYHFSQHGLLFFENVLKNLVDGE